MAESTRTSGVSVHDRQRERAARGVRTRQSLAAAKSDRPAPPRRRRPAMAALAVLLIVGGAALAGLLAVNLDSRTSVIVVKQDVPAGTEITTDLLSTSMVASEGLKIVPEDQVSEVLGTYARVPISEGQLLDTTMLTTGEVLADDTARVGVQLVGGRAPTDLRSGDEVRLIRLAEGAGGEPTPLATAIVLRTSTAESGGLVDGGSGGGGATLMVPSRAADDVVDASAGERLGIALIRRGVAVDEADLSVLGGPR
ncbi:MULTISPECIES: SAF domain-containing protein [Mumia]|uniref:SAF domain-containing protein n=1 Tax=Mumia TaxID=1546255 RepID=UPI0014200E69|nr:MULTISPECIES: SAF domain-containing protein [unclassified Mumia]QMW64749.1 hypothetical protein H4N58_10810 [Mumia sp. ZJ1417]